MYLSVFFHSLYALRIWPLCTLKLFQHLSLSHSCHCSLFILKLVTTMYVETEQHMLQLNLDSQSSTVSGTGLTQRQYCCHLCVRLFFRQCFDSVTPLSIVKSSDCINISLHFEYFICNLHGHSCYSKLPVFHYARIWNSHVTTTYFQENFSISKSYIKSKLVMCVCLPSMLFSQVATSSAGHHSLSCIYHYNRDQLDL